MKYYYLEIKRRETMLKDELKAHDLELKVETEKEICVIDKRYDDLMIIEKSNINKVHIIDWWHHNSKILQSFTLYLYSNKNQSDEIVVDLMLEKLKKHIQKEYGDLMNFDFDNIKNKILGESNGKM